MWTIAHSAHSTDTLRRLRWLAKNSSVMPALFSNFRLVLNESFVVVSSEPKIEVILVRVGSGFLSTRLLPGIRKPITRPTNRCSALLPTSAVDGRSGPEQDGRSDPEQGSRCFREVLFSLRETSSPVLTLPFSRTRERRLAGEIDDPRWVSTSSLNCAIECEAWDR